MCQSCGSPFRFLCLMWTTKGLSRKHCWSCPLLSNPGVWGWGWAKTAVIVLPNLHANTGYKVFLSRPDWTMLRIWPRKVVGLIPLRSPSTISAFCLLAFHSPFVPPYSAGCASMECPAFERNIVLRPWF